MSDFEYLPVDPDDMTKGGLISSKPADLTRIADLIDRSSLGTPGARQLQQRTSDEELEHIRRLAEDMGEAKS